jgi:hypothetical protein
MQEECLCGVFLLMVGFVVFSGIPYEYKAVNIVKGEQFTEGYFYI